MANKNLEAHFVECIEKENTKKALYIVELLGDDVNRRYKYKSLLVWAKKFNNQEVIEALEKKGAQELFMSENDMRKLTDEFYEAIRFDEIEKVRTMIEDGFNVNRKNKLGASALGFCATFGRLEIAKLLVEKGANVNLREGSFDAPPLFSAISQSYLNIASFLIEKGTDLDKQDNRGYTVLMMSIMNGHYDLAKKLIRKGANVNLRDNKGETALMFAVRYEKTEEIMESLIEAGADVNLKNYDGKTAIMLAEYLGIREKRKLILDTVKRLNKTKEPINPKQSFMGKVKEIFDKF